MILKTRFWLIILAVVAIGCFLLGIFIKPGNNGVVSTNWIIGNKTNFYTNFTEVTNNTQYLQEVFFDYIHFMGDSFRFIQLNDSIRVDLWKRNATIKIKDYKLDSGPIAGFGWDALKSSPAALFGWEFDDTIGVLGTATISTNFGFAIFGFWKFNIY